jgi:hypothetical protein
MGRIRGTAAIAEEQQFVSFAKGRGDQFRHLYDAIDMLARELLLDSRAVGKCTEDEVFHEKRF